MKTLVYYLVYLSFAFVLMLLFYVDYFSPVVETVMATILLWTFVWALSVTQVVFLGKMLRKGAR